MDTYPLVGREVIVVVLYNHILKLGDNAPRRGGFLGMHIDSYHYRGGEILTHHINREIVVNAPVVHLHPANLDWGKHCGETHRRPDSIGKHAAAAHHLMFVRNIRCHTAERHEQTVEITAALRRICGKQIHECKIHREWRNQACRHQPRTWHGITLVKVDIQRGKCRGLRLLKEIIREVGVNLPGRPACKTFGKNQVEHFGRCILRHKVRRQ